jgi:small conductance mechanosensitive channel
VPTLPETSIEPLDAIIAAVVVLIGWILSRVTRRAVTRFMSRLDGLTPDMRRLAARSAGYLVLFTGFGVALTILGFPVQPFLAVALVILVVVVLAGRGIAENFAAGVVLQTRRPISIGDEVDALGYNGVVKDIDSRAVVIETWDGKLVHLPNSEVLANPLVNDTNRGVRRSEIEVRVESTDVEGTRRRILEATRSAEGVLTEPEPMANLTAVDPDRVTTLVQFWHDPNSSRLVTSNVIASIAKSLPGVSTAIAPRPVAPLTPPPRV